MNNCTSYWRVLTPTALFSSSVFLYTLSLSLLFPVNAFSSIQNGVAAGSFESIYFLLNPKFQTGTLQIMSLSDGNTITVGNTTLNLNENQTGSIPAGADLESGAIIQGTRQFSLSSEVDTTDLPVPGHFIGTQFAIPHFRGDHTYYILSPYDDAQLTITQAGIPTLVTALKGQVLEFDAGPTNDISGLIQSDQPVLISHIANMGTLDAYPVPPTSKKLWGIHSNNTSVGAFEDDTTITVYGSTGATESFTLNAGGYRMLTLPDGLEGSGSAIHIAADKPIAAIQSADSDGGDATAFLNTAYLATDYGIPVNTQYIAVVCPKEGTTVSLYTNSSSPANQTCDGNGTNPGKAYFGSTTDGTNIAAGARLKSNHPVYIYFETSATNDEHNILGHKESYYVLNSRIQNTDISIMSLIDGNKISAGTTEISLNKNELGIIPAGNNLTPTTEIIGLGPFAAGSDYDGTDLPVPAAFSGTQFVIPHQRATHTYAMLSTYGDANVEVTLGSAIPNTISLPQGQLVEFPGGSDTTIAGLLKSDRPILVAHKGNTSMDTYPVPPASTELWGIRSSTAVVGALENNTTITVYTSDGQNVVYTLNSGQKTTIDKATTLAKARAPLYT